MQLKLARYLFKQHTILQSQTEKAPCELLMGRKLMTEEDKGVYLRNYGTGSKRLTGKVIKRTAPANLYYRSRRWQNNEKTH